MPDSRWKLVPIHALREEGDTSRLPQTYTEYIFLSTPSARRATTWGKPMPLDRAISIHALREEGDSYFLAQAGLSKIFLSTPSARRVTTKLKTSADLVQISIHALCEEGDSKNRDKISIFL